MHLFSVYAADLHACVSVNVYATDLHACICLVFLQQICVHACMHACIYVVYVLQAWSMLREPDMSDVLHTPGVVDALRRYICEVLQLTFSTISLGDFCLMLNLNSSSSSSSSSNASAAVDEKVEKLIKARGWSIEEGISGGKVVRITPRDADSPKAVATRASVAHKTVEKYLSPEGLQQCLSLLQC